MTQQISPKHESSTLLVTAFPIIALIFGFLIALLLVWYAIDVFLIAFGGILLAILLTSITKIFRKGTSLHHRVALTIVLIGLAGIFTLVGWLFAPKISEQFQQLVEQLPDAIGKLKHYAGSFLEDKLTTDFLSKQTAVIGQVAKFFTSTFGAVASFVIFLFVGIFVAYDGERYIKGFLLLIPEKRRPKVAAIIYRVGDSLQWWLMGQFISMSLVGTFTFIGLWLLKIPLALILAVIAALLTFVPSIGPLIAFIPAVFIALIQSPKTALYVVILYASIHVVESYLLTPFIQQRTVLLPPALTVMTQVLLGFLIGILGIALATPLLVVAVVVIREVYLPYTNPSHKKAANLIH